MTRQLRPGLVAEGETDELFLAPLIHRQLLELVDSSAKYTVEVGQTRIGGCRTTGVERGRVAAAITELVDDCHLIFVHHDHNERREADRLIEEMRDSSPALPMIPLVPVRETEAWLLADRAVWESQRGARTDGLCSRPRDVEKIAVPKHVLENVVPERTKSVKDLFEYVGRRVDLAKLRDVPAYARWVADTEEALRELHYI